MIPYFAMRTLRTFDAQQTFEYETNRKIASTINEINITILIILNKSRIIKFFRFSDIFLKLRFCLVSGFQTFRNLKRNSGFELWLEFYIGLLIITSRKLVTKSLLLYKLFYIPTASVGTLF